MKKVLLIGGAGYIGTALLPLLLDNQHEVVVFDNLLYGGDQLLPYFRHPRFKFIKGDITKPEELATIMDWPDIIIHLAAIVGYPACRKNPELAKKVNIDGTKNIIELAKPEQLIIYSSTGSNYGAVEEICTEETPLHPLSLYGQTKTIAENLIITRANSIVFRFATAFGSAPRFRLDLLPNEFTYRMLTQGYIVVYEKHFMRTFIHVHDMARAFIFAINHSDQMLNNTYNIGSETMNYSKEEICNLIKQKTNGYIHYAEIGEDQDKRNYIVDYSKIRSLGFTTTITMEEGINELIQCVDVLSTHNKYLNV